MNRSIWKTAAHGALTLALAMGAQSVLAKVSPEEAAKLGKELTPVGAEKAANKEGTIPPRGRRLGRRES